MATPIAPLDTDEADRVDRRASLKSVPDEQLAFDEEIVEDAELEAALEKRLAKKVVVDAARKAYEVAADEATAEIVKLNMEDDSAVRCGRFRITKKAIPERQVSFTAKASSRVQITLLGDD